MKQQRQPRKLKISTQLIGERMIRAIPNFSGLATKGTCQCLEETEKNRTKGTYIAYKDQVTEGGWEARLRSPKRIQARGLSPYF